MADVTAHPPARGQRTDGDTPSGAFPSDRRRDLARRRRTARPPGLGRDEPNTEAPRPLHRAADYRRAPCSAACAPHSRTWQRRSRQAQALTARPPSPPAPLSPREARWQGKRRAAPPPLSSPPSQPAALLPTTRPPWTAAAARTAPPTTAGSSQVHAATTAAQAAPTAETGGPWEGTTTALITSFLPRQPTGSQPLTSRGPSSAPAPHPKPPATTPPWKRGDARPAGRGGCGRGRALLSLPPPPTSGGVARGEAH